VALDVTEAFWRFEACAGLKRNLFNEIFVFEGFFWEK
jgi:hypothetical protein